MTARILVGTCSWADKTLVDCGRFYPPDAKTPEARLRFYARNFPIVEVDSSYYALPTEQNSAAWVERTPADFVFDVKAFRLFTGHGTPPNALPPDLRGELPAEMLGERNLYDAKLPAGIVGELWRRFGDALLPLDSAGKLGVVLFQFPPWFLPSNESRDLILRARERLPQYRLAVEFRNANWMSEKNRDRTTAFLAENRLSYVCVDEPQGVPQSAPPVVAVTAPIALVRFHGRNAATWTRPGLSAAERFDYLYDDAELMQWESKVADLAEKAEQVHLLFNNCHEDKAVVNARDMIRHLGLTLRETQPRML